MEPAEGTVFTHGELKGEMNAQTQSYFAQMAAMTPPKSEEEKKADKGMTPETIGAARMMMSGMIQAFKAAPEYADHHKRCTEEVETTWFDVPIADGKESMQVAMAKPKNLKSKAAHIHAHGGGAVALSAQETVGEIESFAMVWGVTVFGPNYRKGPECPSPGGQQDFVDAIQYIYDNADKFDIDKDHIGIGGTSGGGWICLGASHLLAAQGKTNLVKAQILMTPMIMDAVNMDGVTDVRPYEIMVHAPGKGNIFDLLSPSGDRNKEGDNIQVYPGRASIDQLKKIPPAVVLWSEMDMLARDAELFIPKLKEAGKYLDHQNMPGCFHGYWMIMMPETVMFYEESGKAFHKYVANA